MQTGNRRRVPVSVGLALAVMIAGAGQPSRAPAQQIVSTGESFLEAGIAVGEAQGDGRREAGLVLEIKPGWKTYWRSPGEAGVPPSLDWGASENLRAIEIAWPRPMVFDSFGYRTLGYGGRVVLPLMLTAEDPGRAIVLRLEGDLGVCREICVFERISLARRIAPDAPPSDRAAIGVARLSLPVAGAEAGVSLAGCRIAGAGTERRFSAVLRLPEGAAVPHVVLEGPEGSWFEDVTAAPREAGGYALSASFHAPAAPAWIDRREIVTTVLAGGLAAEVTGCDGRAEPE